MGFNSGFKGLKNTEREMQKDTLVDRDWKISLVMLKGQIKIEDLWNCKWEFKK